MQLLIVLAVVVLASAQYPPPQRDCITQPTPYGPCSASCAGGQKTRQLRIVQQQSGYGKPCPQVLTETISCNTQPCPVDCIIQPGSYGPCSATCGFGATQTKIDVIVQQAQFGGRQCPNPSTLVSTRPCTQLPPCPVPKDCQIGFNAYSQCSAPCGGGTQSRTAFVIAEAENGGAPCPDLSTLTDTRQCNTDIPCNEPKNCEFVTGEFGDCSATCGQGVKTRKLFIVAEAENGGTACPIELVVQTQPCNAGPCPQPQDCQMNYPPFSACTATCGGGSQQTTGEVIVHPTKGGAPCPDYGQRTVTRSCGNAQCLQILPRDCEIVYGEYSLCSVSCGSGFRTRKGYVKHEAENGGLPCSSLNSNINRFNAGSELVEKIPCNQQACPVPKDCVVERPYFGDCSKPCGGGIQTRQLQIVQQPEFGGLACPLSLTESRPCNDHACGYGQRPQPRPQPRPQLVVNTQFRPQVRPARINPVNPALQTSFNFGGYQQ